MNWDAIGAIGQAVSAMALVFVIVQVRHARDEMRRTTVLTRLHSSREVYMTQATNEGLASLLIRARDATGSAQLPAAPQYFAGLGFSREESVRLSSYHWALWLNFQAAVETSQHLSPGVMCEAENIAINNYGKNSTSAKWFELTKPILNPDAVRYVENLLARSG